MASITCPTDALPPPPPAIVRFTRNPSALPRPKVLLARKAQQPKRGTAVKTLCNEPPAPSAGAGALQPLQMPAAEALPMLAALPAVPAAPLSAAQAEPLAFDAPAAGPTVASTWTLAAAPPPAWLQPTVTPWTLPTQLPVVPEPPTLLLVAAGLAAIVLWRRR